MLFYKSLYPDARVRTGSVSFGMVTLDLPWLSDSYSVSFHNLCMDTFKSFIASGAAISSSFQYLSIILLSIWIIRVLGFRLDAIYLFYFFPSKDAVASVSIWMVLGELWQWLFMLSCCMLFLRRLAEEAVAG